MADTDRDRDGILGIGNVTPDPDTPVAPGDRSVGPDTGGHGVLRRGSGATGVDLGND